jgi:hypothetical protein
MILEYLTCGDFAMNGNTHNVLSILVITTLLITLFSLIAACSGGNSSDDQPLIEYMIVLGTKESGEIAIKKYDSRGVEDTERWNKVLTGTSGRGSAVSIDSDNNVYICYYSSGSITAIKYDSEGNEDTAGWGFNINYNPTSFMESAVDQDNNIYFCGYTGSSNASRRWWVKKYSSEGVEDTTGFWDDQFDLGYGYSLSYTVACDPDNAIYVAGRSMDTEFGDDNNDKWLIKKFNTNGTEITGNWPYLDLEGLYYRVHALAFDSSKNVYAVGYTGDWRIKKFIPDGTEDTGWNITVNTGSSGGAISVALDDDDNVYVLGYDNSGVDQDIMLKRYAPDASEDPVWNKIMDSGGWDRPHQVVVDRSNCVYITGHDQDDNLWLRKYDSEGTMAWEKTADLKCLCGNLNIQNIALFH